jgi:hypothetical protein
MPLFALATPGITISRSLLARAYEMCLPHEAVSWCAAGHLRPPAARA